MGKVTSLSCRYKQINQQVYNRKSKFFSSERNKFNTATFTKLCKFYILFQGKEIIPLPSPSATIIDSLYPNNFEYAKQTKENLGIILENDQGKKLN